MLKLEKALESDTLAKFIMKKLMSIICIAFALNANAGEDSKSAESNKQDSKKSEGLDVDRVQCTWNKTQEEIKEHCDKPKSTSDGVAHRLDNRLKKDAKTIKGFFGIGKDDEKKKKSSSE